MAQATTKPSTETDALAVLDEEIDRLFREHDLVVDRSDVDAGLARWRRKNGQARYRQKLRKRRNGKRVVTDGAYHSNYVVLVNERILEHGNRDGFIDTIRHELAHVEAWVRHGSAGHGEHWRSIARELGADPSSQHDRYSVEPDYYVGCPNCGRTWTYLKKVDRVTNPGRYHCPDCNTTTVSWATGNDIPDRPGKSNL